MMLYHFDHRTITATKSGTPQKAIEAARASLRYIKRHGTVEYYQNCEFSSFLKKENFTRKNARISDKIIVALPREATPHDRRFLVKRFLDKMGNAWNNVPVAIAFHTEGHDSLNPHAHLMLSDRPFEGCHKIGLTHFKSTEKMREIWAETLNEYAKAHDLPPVSHEKKSDRTRKEQRLYQEAKRLRAALQNKNKQHLLLKAQLNARERAERTLREVSERQTRKPLDRHI